MTHLLATILWPVVQWAVLELLRGGLQPPLKVGEIQWQGQTLEVWVDVRRKSG